MNYETTSEKFVVVLNRAQPAGVLINACSHLFIGLGERLKERAQVLAYPAPDLAFTGAVSAFPVIVLEAKGSRQLRTLQVAAGASPDVTYNVFVTSMIGASADEQMERTRVLTEESVEFIAVALFGPRPSVESLTKRFSLFKSRQSAEVVE